MADDQDRTTPTPQDPEPSQPQTGDAAPAAPAEAFQPQQPSDPAQQPAQPYQPTAPYGQPPQPPEPGQPAAPYGQPAPGYYPPSPKSGKAVGALVCGILAILLAWMILPSIILGIVAIVLAVKAAKEAGKDSKATGGKVCGIIGIVLSVLSFMLYLMLGFGVLAYVLSDPDMKWVTEQEIHEMAFPTAEDEQQAIAAAKAELDKLKNQDPAFMQELMDELDDSFAGESGYELHDLGVDPAAVAQWLLSDFDYAVDHALSHQENKGSVLVTVYVRDVGSFASTFASDVQAFVDSVEPGSLDEQSVKAKLGELFNAAMAKTTTTIDDYLSIELEKKGGTWVVDEDAWSSQRDYLLGINQ